MLHHGSSMMNSNLSFLEQPSLIQPLSKPSPSKFFLKQAKERAIDIDALKELIPCSLEAVDHLDEIYIEGKSKLDEELKHAKQIPANQRRLVSKKFLNIT